MVNEPSMDGRGVDTASFTDLGKGAFRCNIIAYSGVFEIVDSPFSFARRIRAEVFPALVTEIALCFFGNATPFCLE